MSPLRAEWQRIKKALSEGTVLLDDGAKLGQQCRSLVDAWIRRKGAAEEDENNILARNIVQWAILKAIKAEDYLPLLSRVEEEFKLALDKKDTGAMKRIANRELGTIDLIQAVIVKRKAEIVRDLKKEGLTITDTDFDALKGDLNKRAEQWKLLKTVHKLEGE